MARDIKFRAWHKKGKDFVLPSKTYISLDGKELAVIYFSGLLGTDEMEAIEMDNDLVFEQYTGLKDKNGKEIYEGDIIQETIVTGDTTDGAFQYEVYWDDDMLCWSIKGISDIDYHLHTDLWETNASREVIGNIHEGVKNG